MRSRDFIFLYLGWSSFNFYHCIYLFLGCAGSSLQHMASSFYTGFSKCSAWLWAMGLVAHWHMGSEFPDQGLNPVPCIGRSTINHWTTRVVPSGLLNKSSIKTQTPMGAQVCFWAVVSRSLCLYLGWNYNALITQGFQ